MHYMLLIYGDERVWEAMSADEQRGVYDEYAAFSMEIRERGILLAADELKPTATATTVRVRNGKTLVADGPFVETNEKLGGFYLVECADMDEAIEVAAKIPSARGGSIEVRPVVEG